MNCFNFLEERNLYSFKNTKSTVISQHQFKKKNYQYFIYTQPKYSVNITYININLKVLFLINIYL